MVWRGAEASFNQWLPTGTPNTAASSETGQYFASSRKNASKMSDFGSAATVGRKGGWDYDGWT